MKRYGYGVLAGLALCVCYVAAVEPVMNQAPGSPMSIENLYDVAVGRIDGDAYPDMATISTTGTIPNYQAVVKIYRNDGTGRMTYVGTVTLPGVSGNISIGDRKIAIADLNRDGKGDLIVGGWSDPLFGEGMRVYLGNGNGGFFEVAGGPFGGIYHEPFLGDVNLDGVLDIVGNPILLGNGLGGFAVLSGGNIPWQTKPTGDYKFTTFQERIGITDVNRDGYPDAVYIAGEAYSSGDLRDVLLHVALGDGTGRMTGAVGSPYLLGHVNLFYSTSQFSGLGYLDGDDMLDFAFMNTAGTDRNVFRGDITQSLLFEKKIVGSITGAQGQPALVDLDGDGRLDLLVLKSDTDALHIWRCTTNLVFTQSATAMLPQADGTQCKKILIADLNDDGKPEPVFIATLGNTDRKLVLGINATPVAFVPSLAGPNTAGGMVGQPFTLTLNAYGSRPLTATAANLPAGLTMNGLTIQGTPTAAGQREVTITVNNSAGMAKQPVRMTIQSAGGVNRPPVVSVGPDRTVTTGQPLALSATVSDDGLPVPPGALTCRWSGGAHAVFANAEATNTTVTFAAPGTYNLRLTASDGQFEVSDELVVTVTGATLQEVWTDAESVTVEEGKIATFNCYITDATVSTHVRVSLVRGERDVVVFNGRDLYWPCTTAGVVIGALRDADTVDGEALLRVEIVRADGTPDPYAKTVRVHVVDTGTLVDRDAGDLNRDGVVNAADLQEVVGRFGVDYSK